VPANTTFVSFAVPAGWSPTTPAVGGTGTVSATYVPALPAGSPPQVFTLVVRVNTNTPKNAIITDTATVSTSSTDLVPGNDTASTTTTAHPVPLPLVVGADAGGGPHVKVYDPITGNLKFSFYAYAANFTGGVRVAAGDINGDGIPDIVTAPG